MPVIEPLCGLARGRWLTGLVAAGILAAGILAAGILAAALVFSAQADAAAAFSNADGIDVLAQHQLDPRLIALSVSTDALNGPANVRILLPTGYAAHPGRRYPVLYLLHGTSGGAADWTTMGDAEQTTAGRPLIVVMPDIAQNENGGGWCTDWYNAGAYGRPQWERFHIDQLIPWVDHNLRTIPDRQGRAIAGLSEGGFCSMSYAARHPDLFSAALAFSGAPDIAYDAQAQALVTPIINLTETALDGVPANSMFGPHQTNEINWAAHDPTTLAENLRGMQLLMYTGNGQTGPLDPVLPNPEATLIESGVHQLTTLFHARLQALGIPSVLDDYGPGTHTFPYWARDLRWSIGAIMANFTLPPPAPASVTYTSAEPSYAVFGWSVTTHRKVREFSTLRSAAAGGFELAGSGSATVVTPPRYRRHDRYRIAIHAPGATATTITEPTQGQRLTIQVPLGPSNPVAEYPADGPALGTAVYTTRVAIVRVAAKRSKRAGRSAAVRR